MRTYISFIATARPKQCRYNGLQYCTPQKLKIHVHHYGCLNRNGSYRLMCFNTSPQEVALLGGMTLYFPDDKSDGSKLPLQEAYGSQEVECGSLNRNTPCKLMCLNSWP